MAQPKIIIVGGGVGARSLAAARRAPEPQMKRRNKSQPAKGYVFAAVGVLRQLPKIRTRVLCAIFCFPFGLWGQADAPVPQVKPAETAPIDIRIPGRLRRLIAPMPSAPWHAPNLRGYTSEPKFAELSAIDPQKRYELVELIDLAQRLSPETRIAWESAEEQLRNGLATITDVSLARQQEAQAAFDLQDVLAAKRDAEVALAESIGIPPATPVQITEFPAVTPPATLEASIDKVIDQALEKRPDLIAKVAALRSEEAEVRSAHAASRPTLALSSNFNTMPGGVQITGGTASTGWFSSTQPNGGVAFFCVEYL